MASISRRKGETTWQARYRDETGKLKGDASICYLRKESIQLAIQMQDGCPLRYTLRRASSQIVEIRRR